MGIASKDMKQENRSAAETPFTQDARGRVGKPWQADSKTISDETKHSATS